LGAIEDIEGLCMSGLQARWAVASAHAPLVVLAESKTDTEFLEAGLPPTWRPSRWTQVRITAGVTAPR
jgi:hypothetical protein